MVQTDWFFLLNPVAGGGKKIKKWRRLEKLLQQEKIGYTCQKTQSEKQVSQLIEHALQQGYRRFVVVGGDGSVNVTVNALLKQEKVRLSEIVISVLPWGTGNDFAAYYQLPKCLVQWVVMLKQQHCVKHDVGVLDYKQNGEQKNHYFINFVGAGFDSYVLEKMGTGKGAAWRYYYYLLRCLKAYCSPNFTLKVNGRDSKHRALLLMACIGRFGGAGMKFAPQALADDGLFNIVLVGDMPFTRRLASLKKLIDGKINQHPLVQTWESEKLEIDSDQPLSFQCDGEIISALPVSISCIPKALSIVVPSRPG